MANIHQLAYFSCGSFNQKLSKSNWVDKTYPIIFSTQKWKVQCTATKQHPLLRRLATDYQQSSWSYELMESISSRNFHVVEDEEGNIKKMEKEIKCMLENEVAEPLAMLELIDDIHRLGLGYRFQDSIKNALDRLILHQSLQVEEKIKNNLHASALLFRLLRQHGYCISADIFESFKDSKGKFKASLGADNVGMLSLYEASHLAFDGESTLNEARAFASCHLNKTSSTRVNHALELPLHKRMQRLEARWNIDTYDKQDKASRLLHKLAVLDFNMVQSVHQSDLLEASRWWRHVGLANKLSFARDRLMESFFWTVGMVFEPQFSKCRIGLTKVVQLITVLDDIYDVYGSPQELAQLTDAVDKWDVNSVNDLPDYMKLCFFALYNTVNELAYDTLKEQDQVVISHLRQGWADLCKAFLREAKWSNEKHIPKFEEYLNHGWISSSGAVLLTRAYFLMTPNITDEAIKSLGDSNGLLRFPCTVFRLANDLSSAEEDRERGEVAKAVSCFMQETGASPKAAQTYLKQLIDHNWKMMNKEITHNSIFDKSYIQTCCNLARIAMCQYQYGDAHTAPTTLSRNRVKSVIVDPIQIIK